MLSSHNLNVAAVRTSEKTTTVFEVDFFKGYMAINPE
jgi:hypothetical protein